ncbi:hypothetical protein IC582_016148 [Cucumis melo]
MTTHNASTATHDTPTVTHRTPRLTHDTLTSTHNVSCFYLARLDLYLPKHIDGPKPVVAFIIDGAWIIG